MTSRAHLTMLLAGLLSAAPQPNQRKMRRPQISKAAKKAKAHKKAKRHMAKASRRRNRR